MEIEIVKCRKLNWNWLDIEKSIYFYLCPKRDLSMATNGSQLQDLNSETKQMPKICPKTDLHLITSKVNRFNLSLNNCNVINNKHITLYNIIILRSKNVKHCFDKNFTWNSAFFKTLILNLFKYYTKIG